MKLSYPLCRRVSGVLFLCGNLFLLLSNVTETNGMQLVSSILFLSCSCAVILSAANHLWLFYWGTAIMMAYLTVGLSNGLSLGVFSPELIAIMSGFLGGILLIRAGFQRHTGRQYPLPFPLSLTDKYPLACAGIIQGSGCLAILASALLLSDFRLAIASAIWCVAHGFLIASDEYLRKSSV